MQVKYKRDTNRNYMILGAEQEADYQLKMLCTNKIKGLLPTHTNWFNGNLDIYYDISSRQPISRLYEKKELQAEDIKAILFSLQVMLAEIKKHLLDYRNVLFAPEFCYCNPEDKKMEWTFFPGDTHRKGFMELAEFFIERVNHSDKDAVDLAYQFFKGVKEDNLVLAEIVNTENNTYGEEVIEENSMEDNVDFQQAEDFSVQENHKGRVNGLWWKIKQMVLGKTEGIQKEGEAIHKPVCKKQIFTVGQEYYEPEMESNYSGETVVMGMDYKSVNKRLKSRDTGECIPLTELPCVLGKMTDCADVVLRDKSVSRMHARIFQKENELYLEDLNSTNGTYVNGLLLDSNEIIKIKAGDEIGFGNLRYFYE